MKVLQITLLLAAVIGCAFASSATWGSRNNTDLLLMSQSVYRTPIAMNTQNVNVAFPQSGQTNTRRISGIFVYDRFTNSSGATPSLWSGGVGFTFATINLNSQFGRGINSTVEIWGR